MKRKRHHVECWTPQPGSWEEAVEPFEEEVSRPPERYGTEGAEMPVAVMREISAIPPALQA